MKKKIRVVVDTNIFINSWFSNKYLYCDAVIDLISIVFQVRRECLIHSIDSIVNRPIIFFK